MKISQSALVGMIDYARLAPSVHNTQPWLFKLGDGEITVLLNKERTLRSGDPVGRQTWISIGCCVEALAIAATAAGFSTNISSSDGDQVKIELGPSSDLNDHDKGLAASIQDRFTDRSVYSPKAVPAKSLAAIKDAPTARGTAVVATEDPELIKTVAELTSRGIRLALSNPEFRNELSNFVVPPFSKRLDGIPTRSLRLNTLGGLFELATLKFGLNVKERARDEYGTWLSSPALILVLSQGDSKEYWLNAGRTYMRCALEATRQGLRSATSAAAVEAADFHEDIEKMVGSDLRLQTVMRIGYSDELPVHSPRLGIEELLLH